MSHKNLNPVNPNKPKRVAIVLANPTISTTTGWPVGFWWSELTHPYFKFSEKGYAVEIFSYFGGACEGDAMSIQLEGCLLQFANQQAACERIKTIPIPRQYDYFTRVFVHLFAILLPFCLIGTVATTQATWLLIPLTLVLTFVFSITERTGAVNEEPFENRITDVPLSAICRTIERDLREGLGETKLPPRLEAKDGYLF